MRCAVNRDVTGRIAAADHQHPLARDLERLCGRLVVAGMEECAGERAGDVWPPRLTVVAGGDDDTGVGPGFTVCRVHRPAAARGRIHPLDGCVRADMWYEIEVPSIATQIIEALRVVGIGRPLPRHREVGVGRERLRTNQPGRREDARCGRAEIPVATDIILAFEAFGGNARGQQVLERGEA